MPDKSFRDRLRKLWPASLVLLASSCLFTQTGAAQSKPSPSSTDIQLTPSGSNFQGGPLANSKGAAHRAKQISGGKVLRVTPADDGHRVKVLLPSGKVKYIRIDANGNVID